MTTVLEKPLKTPKTRKRSAKSLKREIRDRLWQTDDPDVLWTVLKFIRKTVPKLPELPEELVKALEASKRSVEEGRGIPHEVVMERAKKWLAEH